jgi:hypothetical protein
LTTCIGKPGTSKSLAVELVQTNLQGKASENDFLRALPAVQTFSYQCSPLSTSEGIEQAFQSARRYKIEAPNTVVVVLLDEVGLAEQSPHLPLKVLHKVLDEATAGESVVGISNWTLDPAKMNRAVHLYRPAPTVEDLALTAEGMVNRANLKGYLQAIAKAFNEVYENQQSVDFWGMREFYSTVRYVNAALEAQPELSPAILMTAVTRNYGGRPDELEGVVETFFRHMGMRTAGAPRAPVLDLVRQNISEPQARHLMLLTRNNAALGLLYDSGVLSHDRTSVIFGSDFPLDKTDLQVCLNIQRVKHCMANGVTLVLVHCETLYESMYDLLNQHYTSVGGTLWVRLAFGTHSRLCPIDPTFRVIVVVEKEDAYTRLAPPLLNRFEKQVMERRDVMGSLHRRLARRVKVFADTFAGIAARQPAADDGSEGEDDDDDVIVSNVGELRRSLCGFHSDIICSLALTIIAEAEAGSGWYGPVRDGSPLDLDKLFHEAIYRLLWTATPEAACRVAKDEAQMKALRERCGVNVPEVYFAQQSHSHLASYCERMRALRKPGRPHQTVLMTYSPLFLGAADMLSSSEAWSAVSLCVLHDLSSERDLEQHVSAFFDGAASGSVLLVQCDPRASSLRRVEHAKYICEKALADFMLARGDAFFADDGADDAPAADAETEPGADANESAPGLAPPPAAPEPEPAGAGGEAPPPPPPPPPPTPKAKAKSLDVVILVHLPRGSELHFAIDFDQRWSYAFVDSVLPASDQGLLDVEAMMRSDMAAIVRTVALGKVLGDNFRLAVARLLYMYERSNTDVREQIGVILECLADETFVDVVRGQMVAMVEAFELVLDLERVTDGSGVALVGTFQEALHMQIIDALAAMFAIVLAHMDRNGGLALFADEALRPLWLYLFEKTFADMQVVSTHASKRTVAMGARPKPVEVAADGVERKPFTSRFPFSFYLDRAIESMRESSNAIAASSGSGAHAALQSQFELLRLGQGLSGDLSPRLLAAYMHDFACIHLASDALRPNDKAELLSLVLGLQRADVPLTRLSDIHARYWACEHRLDLYCKLLDAVPSSVQDVLARLRATSGAKFCAQLGMEQVTYACDIAVLQLVEGSLHPVSQGWQEFDDYGRFCVQMDMARSNVLSLLDSVYDAVPRDQAAVRACRLGWEKLSLLDHFVRNIAVSLDIEPAVSLKLAADLSPLDLRSQAAFRILVTLLCTTVVARAVSNPQMEEAVRKVSRCGEVQGVLPLTVCSHLRSKSARTRSVEVLGTQKVFSHGNT